ncbi:cytochrome b/b6 domain-containing protein [Roseomonas sp. GC11]|uniref:cytochrome b/b6 domain-containing protein n=1 Tax=Roseomonas sp. GC11 TaxID=2950546 RepID=UPI00210D3DFC|nr:cytochrome b/b6 domain-containing protein [Roseomonas sp. GC11]MCQ4160654.1 cytochrome b/b6 domain-containing protein [Roseomonas sp. GC11]
MPAEPRPIPPRPIPAGWSRAQRRLHWGMAVLVLLAAALGLYMVGLTLRQILQKVILYQVHKSIGLTVLGMALLQLLLHHRRGAPQEPGLPPWQRAAARAVKAALFLLLLATPLLGYLLAATSPLPVPTLYLGLIPVPHLVGADPLWFSRLQGLHKAAAWAMLALAAGHAMAALHHHRAGRAVLRRMWRG